MMDIGAIMTVPEAAKVMRVAEVTTRKWVAERRIPHIRLGSRIMIRKKDVIDFLDKNYHPAKESQKTMK